MKLLWPFTRYTITQLFGEHKSDYTQYGLIGHNGIDLAAPLGEPIKASLDGFVEYLEEATGYGHYCRVSASVEGLTYETVYAHQSRFEGGNRPVKAGEVIGYVGNTGNSSGTHCHFGLRLRKLTGEIINYNNGYLGYVDPMPYLNDTMTLSQIVKNGGEYGVYTPGISEDGLVNIAEGAGLVIPKTPEGKVNFALLDTYTKNKLVPNV